MFDAAKSSVNFQLNSLPMPKKITYDNSYTFILLQKLGTLASTLWVFLCLGLPAKKTKLFRSSTVFLLLFFLCVSINPSKAQDYYDYVEEVTDGKIHCYAFLKNLYFYLYLSTKTCFSFLFPSSLLLSFSPIASFLPPCSYSFHF